MARQRPPGRTASKLFGIVMIAGMWVFCIYRIYGSEFRTIDRLHGGDIVLKAQHVAPFVGWSLALIGCLAVLLLVSFRVASHREKMVAARYPEATVLRGERNPELEKSIQSVARDETIGVGDIRPSHPTLVVDEEALRLFGGIATLRPWLIVPRELLTDLHLEDRSSTESDRYYLVADVNVWGESVRMSIPVHGQAGSPYRPLAHDNIDGFAARAGIPLR